MLRIFKRATAIGAIIIISTSIAFVPLTYRMAKDYVVHTYNIPLYAKLSGFLYRDYEYRRLAREITRNAHTDENKIIAVYEWTIEHIKRDIPQDLPIVDDHIWNVVVRGYGTSDQMADVFTTLCSYSGIPAFYNTYRMKDASGKVVIASLVLSFVKVGKRWLVFDVYNRKYFLNDNREIASVDEITKNPELIDRKAVDFKIRGVRYKEFFKLVMPFEEPRYSRPQKQMLGKRILYEMEKGAGIKFEDEGNSYPKKL